ncbi:MAG: sigma-70 family RNA polymerase sigma factor [Janthinobacterium lividum]
MAAAHTMYQQMMAEGGAGDALTMRNEMILQQLPHVHYIASRIHERLPQEVDLYDLVQAGVIGLIGAYGNFDPAKNAQFSTYATFRIKGAILDALRSLDWGSRSLRNKAREIAKTRTEMETSLGRSPTPEELAEQLGISLAKLNEVEADLHGLHLVSPHATVPGSEDESYDLIESAPSSWDNPFEVYAKAESMAPLVAAMATLSEREQLVLSLYYYEELTMREVAQIAGVAVSRVCQIHATAVKKLKTLLLEGEPSAPEAKTR